MKHYSQVFKPTEVQMMLAAFSNMETVHIAAYSHLLDTIGMPEAEYSAFLHYKEMKDKYDYLQQFGVDTPRDIAKTLAVFGAFTEGLQLFASFAILLNFPRFNKMKGMGQIVILERVRDETLHTHLDHPPVQVPSSHENPRGLVTRISSASSISACETIVTHEDAFIDLAFKMGADRGPRPAAEVKRYIRYIADRRLGQLRPAADLPRSTKNPLPWLDAILNGVEHTNFFENRATEYAKAATTGSWEEAFD